MRYSRHIEVTRLEWRLVGSIIQLKIISAGCIALRRVFLSIGLVSMMLAPHQSIAWRRSQSNLISQNKALKSKNISASPGCYVRQQATLIIQIVSD